MSLKTNVFYDFGDFRLDLTEKFLLRDEKLVRITPKVYETLCVLVEDAGRLIEKDELMRRIWQDRFVEESNLTFNIKMLRKALGDDAQKPRFIETVPRRGYRFIADVRRLELKTEIAAQNFGAHESLKPQIAPAHHFTVERRGNVFAVADWQPERMPEAESALHLISPAPRLLFGRRREIAAAEILLRQEAARLVTLTGVGGSGKTTLARVVAENCAPDFPDGVFFVELAAIFSPELVAAAVAQTLGVKDSGGGSLPETLQNFLRTSRALLVLDNFEQVAPAASLLANLLAATARLKILVTSRAALRLSRENELIVPPLAVPPLTNSSALSVAEAENYSAVQMFVERARAVRPNFALSVENAAQVAEICRRLDGLPLAIELAAARVRLLKPPEILRRLANPLQILTSRVEDLPARQRTMRDTIAWSYNLLGKREKTLFKRLAIFSGGFTLETAEAICGNDPCGAEVLDDLESLIGGNLLRQTEDQAGDARLLMLETIREFAAERLAENAEEESLMRRRHADFFLARVKQIERDLFGARQAEMLDRMEADRDNFRRAMDWYRKTDGENELKLAAALTPLYTFRGYLSEGVERLCEAVEANPNTAPAARAKALASLGQLIWVKGDYPRAIAVCEESLSLARRINYPMISALSLFFAGMSYWYQYNDAEKSIAYLEESLNLYRELEFDSGVVFASVVLAAIYQTNNDLTRAAQLLDASMAAAERTGNNLARSIALVNYGRLKFAEGDFERAKQLCRESLRLREELSDKWGLVQCLVPLAAIAAIGGEPRRAAKILGAIDRLLDALNAAPPPIFRADHEPSLKAARCALDEKSFAASFAEGRESSVEKIVEFALEDANNQPRDSETIDGREGGRFDANHRARQ